MDKIFKFDFTTGDFETYLSLNDKELYVGYAEDIIEMENLQGVFDQLLAIMFDWA